MKKEKNNNSIAAIARRNLENEDRQTTLLSKRVQVEVVEITIKVILTLPRIKELVLKWKSLHNKVLECGEQPRNLFQTIIV